MSIPTCLMAIILAYSGSGLYAQIDHVTDVNTGQVASHRTIGSAKPAREPVTILSIQSPEGGAADIPAEADVYRNPDRDPLAVGHFLNLNSSTGANFPGAMMADNMGLGSGYEPGVDNISSYDALFFRRSSDPQPGRADFHMALWDGDPFCAFDTPGAGFSCMPIAGSEADFIDIPTNTIFTARHILPEGVTAPNRRVWMVVSGSQTGVNASPCRLVWDIAYGPARVGDNSITGIPRDDDIFLTQEDENNGVDGPSGQGICCDGSGGFAGSCDASNPCDSDPAGKHGVCWDDFAETSHVFTIATGPGTRCDRYSGSQCSNFTAGIRAPANTTISMIPVSTNNGTISGNELLLQGGPADFELEVRLGNWDPNGEGTLLKAWSVKIDESDLSSGFHGNSSRTVPPCTTDEECRTVFGGICRITGGSCILDADCPLAPIESCGGSTCSFPDRGPDAGTQCEPGFIFTGRYDYVFRTAGGDLPFAFTLFGYLGFSSAVASGNGVPASDFAPFPQGGVYAGTLRLSASADCKGTFTVGFVPPPTSVMVNQENRFIPLVGLIPAKITCEIGRCCFDLEGEGGCWNNVTRAQCDAAPGSAFWDSRPGATCNDACADCVAPAPPQAEAIQIPKSRYLSVVPDNVGSLTALRVTFEDLPNDYAIWNGKTMWVTDPRSVSEFSGSNVDDPPPTFVTASLSCQQDCRDWGALGLIDVFGEGIVPSGQYGVEAIRCGCDPLNEARFSTPLLVSTSNYGDIVGRFEPPSCTWTPPNAIVSIPSDTVAAIAKFTNQPCAARKARTDLVGVSPNRACVDQFISVTDYVETIGAFQGQPYSLGPSDPDPCNALPCPNP